MYYMFSYILAVLTPPSKIAVFWNIKVCFFFFFIVEIKQSNQSVIEDNSGCHHLETTTIGILLRSFCNIHIYTYICHINFNNVVSYWGNLAFLFNDVLYSLNFR